MQTPLNKKTNIFERILELAEIEGIKNIPELADRLGYDSPEKLYRLKRNPNAKPSFDILEDLTNKFEHWNLRYLITGTGQQLLNAEKGADTLPAMQLFQDHSGGYITDTPGAKSGTKTAGSQKGVHPTVQPTTVLSPQFITVDNTGNENILYVGVKAAAGYLNGYADQQWLEKQPAFSLPGLNDATYRAFQVDGDSMYPTLEDKEMVIGKWVEKLDYIREDRVHIIVTKNRGIVVKRLLNRIEQYGYLVAKSDAFDNRRLYENIEIYPDEIVEIWYAVWHGSFNFKSPSDMYKKVNNLEADLTEVMRVLKANKLLG